METPYFADDREVFQRLRPVTHIEQHQGTLQRYEKINKKAN
jgi:hypothetical protein